MSAVLVALIWISSIGIFCFFVVYTLVTYALIAWSFHETAMQKLERGGKNFHPVRRPLRPGISVLAAAYNEAPVIVSAVRSHLQSDYDPLEVVICDDGSTDGTTDTLIEAFDLVELPVGDRFQLETMPIEQMYISRADPRLRVLRKGNGGRSDAINAALNLARYDLVATVDADSLLDRDALARVVEIFSADPDRVVAVGGTIRVANGTVIEDGVVVEASVPLYGTQASQVGEYMRAFFGARIAWSAMNGLLIISGAFGVFRRDLMRSVGGLVHASETLGEDMELVMRMHAQLRPDHPDLRIEFAADANSWTEAPSGLGPLRGQRVRWHIGLLDNLRMHKRMIARRRFGAVGLMALPYTILFEVIAPVLQILGYVFLVVALILHLVAWEYAVALFVIVMLCGQLQTAGAILIEQLGFERYLGRDLLLIAGWSLLEIFWYRPLTAFWRTWATVLTLIGRRPGWGKIPRGVALGEVAESEREPAPLPR
jgi:cellulose synthase/poly-beta-1,6-N-acetylglucosamine synthase-like glycosyltransferase